MDKSRLFVIPVFLAVAVAGWLQGQHSTKGDIAKSIGSETFEEHIVTPSILTNPTNNYQVTKKEDLETPKNQTKENSFMTKEELEAKVERLKQTYKDNPNFDYSLAVKEKFESETIDEQWGFPREKALHQAFETEPYLQGKNLKSIQCRSSHCRIEIFFDDPKSINDIVDDVYRISSSGKYQSLFVNSSDMGVSLQEKVLSVYFSSDLRASLF